MYKAASSACYLKLLPQSRSSIPLREFTNLLLLKYLSITLPYKTLLMSSNRAAWQDEPGMKLSIRSTPYPENPSSDQIVVKAQAWAINPADHILQDSAAVPFIKYPVILGEDIAGTVVHSGSAVASRFKPGDRVLALAAGSGNGKSEMGGFQELIVCDAKLTCHIPDSMSFAEASVFPLGVITASLGLFTKRFLALPHPTPEPVSNGKSILIWGGSSAVGSNAIQLAKAAGFEVFSTSSLRNFEYLQGLGATKVFDYTSETVVADIVAELDRTDCVGVFHAAGDVKPSLQISHKAKADLFVASATMVSDDKVPSGVRAKMLFGTPDVYDEIAEPIFKTFLPSVLAQGKYQVAPEPLVLQTKGLEGIQEGLNSLKDGVSARKVVIVNDQN